MRAVLNAFGVYWVSSLVVAFGVFFGIDYVASGRTNGPSPDRDLIRSFSNFDGNSYSDIAENGYSRGAGTYFTAVFFPGYPLLGSLLSIITGLPVRIALLLLAHIFLLACFL